MVYWKNVYWKKEALCSDWKGQPYQFYLSPKGIKEIMSTFDLGYSLYIDPKAMIDSVDLNGQTQDEWQKCGKDVHSVHTDSLFMNAAAFDFRLKPASPAFQVGFELIGMIGIVETLQ